MSDAAPSPDPLSRFGLGDISKGIFWSWCSGRPLSIGGRRVEVSEESARRVAGISDETFAFFKETRGGWIESMRNLREERSKYWPSTSTEAKNTFRWIESLIDTASRAVEESGQDYGLIEKPEPAPVADIAAPAKPAEPAEFSAIRLRDGSIRIGDMVTVKSTGKSNYCVVAPDRFGDTLQSWHSTEAAAVDAAVEFVARARFLTMTKPYKLIWSEPLAVETKPPFKSAWQAPPSPSTILGQ
jgi:hypothetical protein